MGEKSVENYLPGLKQWVLGWVLGTNGCYIYQMGAVVGAAGSGVANSFYLEKIFLSDSILSVGVFQGCHKFINTNYRNKEIQITKQLLYNSQEYRNTNYRNTDI